MRRRTAAVLVVLAVVASLASMAPPAVADHTNPRTPLSPTSGIPAEPAIRRGIGTWEFIRNFQSNPGTDLKFFFRRGDIYASSGTLGQADEGHVGQRITRLTVNGVVDPQWSADHGSANCPTENPSGTTGLQHDAAVTTYRKPKLLIDTTDATGRCHDGVGGGLEIIDIVGINRPTWEPREIHLTRHSGTSHTVTVDATRPWIVYNSSSDFASRNWIDVVNIRSCFLPLKSTLQEKRDACRPVVHRIQFEAPWTQQFDVHDQALVGGSAACHDITARPGRIYCAGVNATLILDVSGLTDANGNVNGTALACTVVAGEQTGAMVTDCTAPQDPGAVATGWVFLGTYNHPGRDCVFPHPPGQPVTNCNSNNFVESDEGVSISHEADPTEDEQYMFVTDERGGGVVPPGSSCQPGIENPFSNGGAHAFDISNPAAIDYALQPDGSKAVYISDPVLPAATFCDIHVMELIPGEQRFVTAYYSQGTKIVDYHVDENGRMTFEEVASYTPQNANTWVVEDFKIVDNGDGTKTYFFMSSDIQRGIDVFTWTGPPGPAMGSVSTAPSARPPMVANVGLVGLGLILLPLAARFGRRRR
jgi:hypothetical protein